MEVLPETKFSKDLSYAKEQVFYFPSYKYDRLSPCKIEPIISTNKRAFDLSLQSNIFAN